MSSSRSSLPNDLKIKRISADQIPADWRNSAAGWKRLQTMGTEWIKEGASAVLAVPSTVIPAESDYLLNPMHPAFTKLKMGEPQPFVT